MKDKSKKEYKTGREDLDKIIAELARTCLFNDNVDLIEEMLTTVVSISSIKPALSPERVTIAKSAIILSKSSLPVLYSFLLLSFIKTKRLS